MMLISALLLAGAMAAGEDWPVPIDDQMLGGMVLFDQLEVSQGTAGTGLGLDLEGWLGGDYNRLRLRAEAETGLPIGGEGEFQALYSRLIAPYWELQAGARLDADLVGGDLQAYGAIGIEGTAPYWFDVEGTLFIRQDGVPSGRLSGIHEQRFTQRLIGQARADVNLVPQATGIGLGYRLRYEIQRELAPYVGISWKRALGEAAAVDAPGTLSGVGGLRMWW
jgi:copper resistance protein B